MGASKLLNIHWRRAVLVQYFCFHVIVTYGLTNLSAPVLVVYFAYAITQSSSCFQLMIFLREHSILYGVFVNFGTSV